MLPGTQVDARGLRWEVVHVDPAGEQQLVRLRCLSGDLRSEEIDLLTPFEEIRPVATELDPVRAGRLQAWKLYHQAFLLEQALGPDALLACQPGRLDLAPYQLVPVMRAIRMPRPRLLLADGVGLGKTVQAGLVLAELIARRRAHRILLVTPAGPLLEQWDAEMRIRFGLRFHALRRWDDLQEVRRGMVLGANPFDQIPLCLVSIDFAKQEKVLQDLERSSWDAVVIDEAHHCVRMGGLRDREASLRRHIAEVLARQSDGLLLLTATPHDGYDPHFASLVELLDRSLVDARGSLRGESYRKHVVRRLKDHVKDPRTGERLFRERAVHPRPVAFGAERHPRFAELQHALVQLVVPRLRTAVRRRRYEDVLAFLSLMKRSVSTVRACGRTLRAIAERFAELERSGQEWKEERRERLATLRDYRRRVARFGTLTFEEEEDQAYLEAEDMAAELLKSAGADDPTLDEAVDEERRALRRDRELIRRVSETHAELRRLAELADAAEPEDPKLSRLVQELRDIRDREPRANVLVYTEYTDSQAAAVEAIEAAISRGELDGAVLAIRGADDEKARTAATSRFSTEDGLLLVSTDATAEGLNLHARCHHLLHLELPYNPNRLEQRNGRIDRYGQQHDPEVRYLYLSGTFEERLLLRLVAKYERQRKRLTFVPDTLGAITTEGGGDVRLVEGLARDESALFPAPTAVARDLDQLRDDDQDTVAYRELLEEVDRALSGFERAAKLHGWLAEGGIGADDESLRRAEAAREAGSRLGAVDLATFVRGAIEGDGGRTRTDDDGTLVLELPSAWAHGLERLPGYDAEARVVRLSTQKERERDESGRDLGFLGRAHPLVRRAIDRVRNVQYGSAGALDRRVGAARSPDGEPALLYTFLGTVESGGDRAFERVLAVLVRADGTRQILGDPEEWAPLLDEPVPTKGLWERSFAPWSAGAMEAAREDAAAAFRDLAGPSAEALRAEHDRERRELATWLEARAAEICGRPSGRQEDLFPASGEPAAPAWQRAADPAERLAAYATDASLPAAARREADGVLRLSRSRADDLARRSQVRILEPAVLGLLMLASPEEDGA